MIYLVEAYGGQYSDSWSSIEKAFTTEEAAKKYIDNCLNSRDAFLKYFDIWEEIEDKFDALDIDWYDGEDVFMTGIKENFPEYLEDYTEEFLLKLYNFYRSYDSYYDDCYYNILTMELED
jgi:hypothetical protein